MTALLLMGGFRFGDTFHLIPLLESLKGYRVTWIAGTYEKPVVDFLSWRYPNIKEVIFVDDGFPTGLSDRKKFYEQNVELKDPKEFDLFVCDYNLSLDTNVNLLGDTEWSGFIHKYVEECGHPSSDSPDLSLSPPYLLGNQESDYICTHSTSTSVGKNFDLDGLKYPRHNFVSLDGSDDMFETYRKVMGSNAVVAIHSCVACMSFYTDRPMVVCHYEKGLLKFSDYRHKIIDLVQPSSKDEILDALWALL